MHRVHVILYPLFLFDRITLQTFSSALTAQIARDLDRDYEAVLDFVHEIQETSGDIEEFDLYDVCEADEIYVTAGEKGYEDEESSPRERGLSKRARNLRIRQTTSPDTRPSR